MPEKRRKFDQEFREGAARIVRETGKPIAQVTGRTRGRPTSASTAPSSPGSLSTD